MLRFHVGRIPVTVHFSHLVVSGLIAWGMASSSVFPPPWGHAGEGSQPEHSAGSEALLVGLWMIIVSLSVLAYELGHAWAATALGFPPHVHLVGLGGLTRVDGAEALSWGRDVFLILSGPLGGMFLAALAGGAALAVRLVAEAPAFLGYALQALAWASLAWSTLNLVPLASLDGGRLAAALLTRALGRPGFLVAQVLSLALAVTLLAWAVAHQELFAVALVVLLVLRTLANIAAYNQGALPQGEGRHPLLEKVQAAEALRAEGRYEEAERAARLVLAQEPPPLLRSRVLVVLGWVELKQGHGPAALQHFGRARGVTVPPQALAAAWSLAGDEARALPLWVEAARRSPGETILHELAGSLIRAGRELEARKLPGVRTGLAYAAAERVYSLRGEFARAAQAAEAAFREEPAPALAYDAACAWARAGDAEAALRMLTLAAQNGYADADAAARDPDLQSLRARPDFQAWLQSVRLSPAS